MKLHLPKQLFTALLAVITLAIPAQAAPNELGVVTAGDFYAGDYAFNFSISEGDLVAGSDTTDVLGLYWGSFNTGNYYSNGYTLTLNDKGEIVLYVGDGSMAYVGGGNDSAYIKEDTAFSGLRGATFTTKLEVGATYTIKNIGSAGSDNNGGYGQTVTLLKNGVAVETVKYNGNMNGGQANTVMVSVGNAEYGASAVSLWKAAADAADTSISASANYVGAFSNLANADLVFSAEEDVAKTVTLNEAGVTVKSVTLYDNYTFNATQATTLTVTEGINIAQGKSLTLQGSAITLTGTFANNGALNIGGSLALTSSSQLDALGATTVKNGGVLDLTGFHTNKSVFIDKVNNATNLTTEAGGYVKMKVKGGSARDDHELKFGGNVTLNKNVCFVDEYVALHGESKDYTLTIAKNTTFRASAGLELWSDARIKVDGGHLIAEAGITLGHYTTGGDHWGKLEMTSGSISTGTISFNQQANNAITITGGELTFTAAQAFAAATGKTVAVHIGAEGESAVTLKTAGTAWTLDGSVLTTAPTIGNVTIDAENAHSITLKNVSLKGAITNNSSLTIGSATVAAGSTVSINGSGTTNLTGTITNNGTLTLSGSIALLGDLTSYDQKDPGSSTYTHGNENGFYNVSSAQYWLTSSGGTLKDTLAGNISITHGEAKYETGIEDNRVYFTTSGSSVGTVFYVTNNDESTGVVLVSAADAAIASGYELRGGTMQLDSGATTKAGAVVTATSAGTINLAAGSTLNSFTKEGSGTITLTGSGTYDLGRLESGRASATIPNSVTMGNGSTDAEKWKGTVRISGGSNDPGNNDLSVQDINFNNLGQAGSTVEIGSDCVYGYLQRGTNTYAANIKFAGDFYIQNSYTDGAPTATFSGNIVAENGGGNIVVSRTNGGTNKYKFTGDVSGWNTSFTQNTTGGRVISEVIFAGAANSINAAIINENQGTLNLEIDTTEDATLSKDVKVSKIVVNNTAKLTGEDNSITAGNATINRQNASLSNVTVQGSSIAATVNTNGSKGTMANADVQIAQLAADASFTIADMTLTNTTITAATVDTRVELKNVSGDVALKTGAFGVEMTTVGMGGSALSYTEGAPSITLSSTDAGAAKLMISANPTLDVQGTYGTYSLTFNLNLQLDTSIDLPASNKAWGELVGFEGWLGTMLEEQNATFAGAAGEPVAQSSAPSVSYGYTAGSDGNVGTLVITINGLNVPEPTTSTLSLLALAGLCARRRRKM